MSLHDAVQRERVSQQPASTQVPAPCHEALHSQKQSVISNWSHRSQPKSTITWLAPKAAKSRWLIWKGQLTRQAKLATYCMIWLLMSGISATHTVNTTCWGLHFMLNSYLWDTLYLKVHQQKDPTVACLIKLFFLQHLLVLSSVLHVSLPVRPLFIVDSDTYINNVTIFTVNQDIFVSVFFFLIGLSQIVHTLLTQKQIPVGSLSWIELLPFLNIFQIELMGQPLFQHPWFNSESYLCSIKIVTLCLFATHYNESYLISSTSLITEFLWLMSLKSTPTSKSLFWMWVWHRCTFKTVASIKWALADYCELLFSWKRCFKTQKGDFYATRKWGCTCNCMHKSRWVQGMYRYRMEIWYTK